MEWEDQTREYPEEDKIWADCVDLLKTDRVDLVVLNRAPAVVADVAVNGVPLVMKDRSLWMRFIVAIMRDAIDFRKTAHEYANIYWRSASLTKEDAYEFDRRLVFVKGELSVLSEFYSLDWREYQSNDHTRRIVERTIENIMNAVIDISKMILASAKHSPVPQTYREIVEISGLYSPSSQDTAKRLSMWVDLRNLFAHEYLDVKWKRISDFIQNSEPYFKSFADAAKKFLEQNQPNDS